MQTPVTFNYNSFIAAFPAFSDPIAFPEATLQGYFNLATAFMNPGQNPFLSLAQLTQCLNLYTAHFAQLSVISADGDTPAVTLNATIDKVQVGNQEVPLENQFQYWLQSTSYGQMLLALLQVLSVGGWLVGGWPERAAIRQAFGVFPGQYPGPFLGLNPM